jgi:malate dehydrogenase
MKVVGASDVEAASGRVVLKPGEIVTPLARERAKELGVDIVIGSAPQVRSGATPAGPPSGALYRRGSPVVTDPVDPAVVLAGDEPASGYQPGQRRKRVGRVTVVGAGHVGATTAMRLAEADVFAEIVMVDVVPGLAAGLALDLWHSSKLRGFATRLRGGTDAAEGEGSEFVVVTAGRPRQPGMSRTDLTEANAAIVSEVCDGVARHSPDAIVVMVTNPLDEMTHLAWRTTGFSPQRVLGMAGVLDTTRFCALAALATGQRPDAISAVALGSHGEEMVIPLSQARIGPDPIEKRLDASALQALVERTRDSGAEVVRLLERGSAYYAPAAAAGRMVLAMAQDFAEVLPACVLADGTYGIKDVYLGLPARLGAEGVEEIVELDLTAGELEELRLAGRRIAARVGQLEAV